MIMMVHICNQLDTEACDGVDGAKFGMVVEL